MKAAVFTGYGGPERLEFREIPTPVPRRGEVLVRVQVAAVNPLDWKLRGGSLRLVYRVGFPFVPGVELAGTVETAGPGSRFAPGDPVMAMTSPGGAFAELAVVDEARAVHRPDQLPIAQAAGLLVPGLSALQALRHRAGLVPGQRLLVNGAAGSVGALAVQIGRLTGATVTAVTSAVNNGFVRQLGAEDVIDYARQDFTAANRQWDVVFDVVPNRSFWSCRRVLSPDGVYITTMPGPGPFLAAAMLRVARVAGARQQCRWLLLQPTRADLEQLAGWAADRRIVVPVGYEFPFPRLGDALALSEGRHARGRILVRLGTVPDGTASVP